MTDITASWGWVARHTRGGGILHDRVTGHDMEADRDDNVHESTNTAADHPSKSGRRPL
jgi:hypothetical protein